MTARERLVRLLVQADPLLLDSLYGTQEPTDIADRIRAEVLREAADELEENDYLQAAEMRRMAAEAGEGRG